MGGRAVWGRRSMMLTVAILAVSAVTLVGGLLIGAKPLPPGALLPALFWPDGKLDSILIRTLRLPRSLGAFAGGAGLAVSGHLLQALTRNPLAAPGLTGVMSGAVAPIVFCSLFVPGLSPPFYPSVGLAGGLAAALLTFWISRGATGRPIQLALGGVSVSLLLGAVTTYLLILGGNQAAALLFWLSGGFSGLTWPQLASMIPWVAVGLLGALLSRRVLGLLTLSDAAAAGMGLNLDAWKPALLVLAVLPVAGIVPVAGPVVFVGLAVPHVARLLEPEGPGCAVALSAALGGFTVSVADIVARSVAAPRELPVGIVTALIGGPVFIYLVQRKRFAGGAVLR